MSKNDQSEEFKLPPYCHILIGPPASGKSTWISKNVDLHNFEVLSTDQLIEDYAKMLGKTYNNVFNDYIDQATKTFFNKINIMVTYNKNIIIDRTNMTVKSRNKILDLIPEDYVKVAIVFECSDQQEYIKRLNSRPGKVIPWNVIESMKKSYQPPSEEEGFRTIVYIETAYRKEQTNG
jgi:predicted kinase